MRMDNGQAFRKKVQRIKVKCLQMCKNTNGVGHISSAFSCAEMLVVLYNLVLRVDPHRPDWPNRDRFILSKNHASIILYVVLRDKGFFSNAELSTFLQDGSRLGIHSKINLEGIDFAGGSLGIGVGVGAGLAYAARSKKKNWLTFVLMGDGECHEGAVWESIMFAGHQKLNNLVLIIDKNEMAITDFTDNIVSLNPLDGKMKAFGWDVINIDGHSIEMICDALANIHDKMACSDKPLCIISNTKKGYGVDFMCNKMYWHGRAPQGAENEDAIHQIRSEE